jgi:hypothetical protein
MSELAKSEKQSTLSEQKPRREKDEAILLIVAIRVLQLLIILSLWFVTSYFGMSCFDSFDSHGRSAVGGRRSHISGNGAASGRR